ncbi:glycosyltransferase family 2 protein [Leifsonia flava]|uniref:glycosyltransferase family 2 protein n=1 Tax=Orlajensenia leifsoniae TaxID=2561933 RepID=UPI0014322052|nr:glycosyltransferase family 2 protein [Leifsonia flava]
MADSPISDRIARTLVVLPALNEEGAVGEVVAEVLRSNPGISCLVVDDGSTDDTAGVAARAGAHVARLPFNIGVGGAMRLGFNYAIENGFSTVIQVDADGQHDPSEIPELLQELEGADLVLGARFAGKGEYDASGPRRWAMVLLSRILSRVAGTKLTDTTSGFRATGPRAVVLFAEHYPSEYLGDTVESLVIAARSGCVIRQVPVAMRPRAAGTPSHNPLKAATYLGRAMMALVFALMRPPIALTTGSIDNR